MFELLYQPAASGARADAPFGPPVSPSSLASSYAELEAIDDALREAEQRLKAAHLAYAKREGPCPDHQYREVVHLRERSRELLDDLADLFLGEDYRSGNGDGETDGG